PEMFESGLRPSARRSVADSTTAEMDKPQDATRTLICRACLVLLGPEDNSFSLESELDLAKKYFACTGGDPCKLLPPQDEEDVLPQLVLKSICECCYHLVQKFHDFQRMCEESSRNFEQLLLDIDLLCSKRQKEDAVTQLQPHLDRPSDSNDCTHQEAQMDAPRIESVEEIVSVHAVRVYLSSHLNLIAIGVRIEEVYIVEDEAVKQDLGRERTPILAKRNLAGQRKRRVRHTLDCSRCHRGFYKSSLLEAHMKQHEGINPFTCVLCGKSYARANLLDAHLREMHRNPAERETYPCLSCSKVYTAVRSLKYHVKREHEVDHKKDDISTPQHVCEKCGKSFVRRAHLTRHTWIHKTLDERKYPCDFCDQRFYTKENMLGHRQRKHENENLLRCRKCGRIFPTRSALSGHMEKHGSTKDNVI
ncbi:hypothetical protein KR009_003707, partial [Drosophila setifemur]